MDRKNLLIKIVGLGIALVMLTACSSHGPVYDYQQASTPVKGAVIGAGAGAATGYVVSGGPGVPVGMVAGAAIGGVIGFYLDQHPDEQKMLERAQVQVIKIGDYVKLVIPSSQLFVPKSDELSQNAKITLGQVAKLIKPYPKVAVLVSAYIQDGAVSTAASAYELTDKQAQAVADYLWSHDMDARLVYAKGYGATKPITFAQSEQKKNSRVEITLKELHFSD